MRELSNQEADKREDITRLREAANVEHARCDTLKEEIQRLRSMPGRKSAVLFIIYLPRIGLIIPLYDAYTTHLPTSKV